MTISDDCDVAISFDQVSKAYRMYGSPFKQLVDVCFRRKEKQNDKNIFYALKDLSFEVRRGERIGLVGRNGSGKTTTLKLITQNFLPTKGKVTVNGSVQALMQTGLGVHPEFSGYDNIKASLIYHGLSKEGLRDAIEDVVDFVELGDFLHQPFKNYSMGMQSRLLFATATAINPDILIIDEVLGAGDSYFSAKSADRMKRLANSGCTLLLVSHSTSQVLQFCDKAIWLEAGEKIMEGSALNVVKAYEEYTMRLTIEASKKAMSETKDGSVIQSKWLRQKLLSEVFQHQGELHINRQGQADISASSSAPGQHSSETLLLSRHDAGEMGSERMIHDLSGISKENIAGAAVSRWPSHLKGLLISDVRVLNSNGEVSRYFLTGEEVNLEVEITAEKIGVYQCSFVILIFTEDGRWVLRDASVNQSIVFEDALVKKIKLTFERLYLGAGKYTFSAAIYETLDLKNISTAKYYDLLSRSFEFKIEGPYLDDNSVCYSPCVWRIGENEIPSMPMLEIERKLQDKNKK